MAAPLGGRQHDQHRVPPSSSSTPRRCGRRPAVPGGGLLPALLLLSGFCCGALAGPIVDPHVKAVWGKDVTLKCITETSGTLIQVTWEKIHGKSAQTIAVHHPVYGFSVLGEYQGRVSLKNHSLTDASIILSDVTFSDSGGYVCKEVTFPLGNFQSSTTVTVLVEPIVSLTKGPNTLIDGASQTVAAICTAAVGKPAAEVVWEGGLGEMESTSTSYPNETVTIESQYKLIPTRFARGRHITCVVRHPALEKEIRLSYVLDIQYPPTTTTSPPPTIPWLPSTDGITGLTTQPKLVHSPTSPRPRMQEDNWGTIIGSAVGGAFFLILVSGLVGAIWYRRRTFHVERYSPMKDRWNPCPPLRTCCENLGCATFQGKISAVGGWDDLTELCSMGRSDPLADEWSRRSQTLWQHTDSSSRRRRYGAQNGSAQPGNVSVAPEQIK